MIKILRTNYPFYYDVKTATIISVLVFILSTSFSYAFEPFEVNYKELKFSYLITSVIHSIVSLIVFMSSVILLTFFRDKKKDWQVYNEFSFLFIVLILIGVGQYLIRDLIYLKDDNWSFRYLFEEIRNTLLVGSLLMFIITSINIERLKTIYRNRSKLLNLEFTKDVISNETISIKTKVKIDDFNLTMNDFIYAKSDKNYVEIFTVGGKMLKRMSIKSLEDQLEMFDYIFRSHRSFLLNLNKIEKVQGNTQGYKLSLLNCEDEIPVSRGMIMKFEEELRKLKK
ncbi:LytTR family DNA-binding domain-containing protein [Tenacibaculum sp. 190524A05c]|uniref:LytR/AlgR family response regulator transcription factor n=1 Tax=Tenacibaculum platacis TaxID=3137852 RepID=UPI0032B2F1B2